MHPTDHTSIAFVYSFQESIISGARYQRVATYSVMKPAWFSSGCATRASPKSHTFRSQLPLSSRLDGLRSRCSTCAEWMYLSARRIW